MGDPMIALTNIDVQNGDAVHGLRLRVNGGAGNDVIFMDITDFDDTNGNYDIAIRGDDGVDTVDLDFDDDVGNTFGADGNVLIDGGLGADSLTSPGTAPVRIINQ